MRTSSFLDHLQIASPCEASWDAMTGDDRARHCAQCDKKVYNLAALTREEAMALFGNPEALPCLRLWKRADGTVMTADCPVGLKLRRRERRIVAGAVMLVLAACGPATAQAPTRLQGEVMLQGAPAPTRPAPPAKRPPRPRPSRLMGKVAAPIPEPVQGLVACPAPKPPDAK
jgi:hypothetical protein